MISYTPSNSSEAFIYESVTQQIDYQQTLITWTDHTKSGIAAYVKTEEQVTYQMTFYDVNGNIVQNPKIVTDMEILFADNQPLINIRYQITSGGAITLVFSEPGLYFIKGYRVGGQEFFPFVDNGPVAFHVEQAECHDYLIVGQTLLQSGQ